MPVGRSSSSASSLPPTAIYYISMRVSVYKYASLHTQTHTDTLPVNVDMNIHTHTHTYIHTYMFLQRDRESVFERERVGGRKGERDPAAGSVVGDNSRYVDEIGRVH